eukprot:12036161-Alexandrium_andersonii.AAC.1
MLEVVSVNFGRLSFQPRPFQMHDSGLSGSRKEFHWVPKLLPETLNNPLLSVSSCGPVDFLVEGIRLG